MGKFLEMVTDRTFSFQDPFLFMTKGEMCQSLSQSQLASLVALTVSCHGFPQRIKGQPQCGQCTSCLLRRVSLHAAGLARVDATETYRPLMTDDGLYQFRAMLTQVMQIRRALVTANPWGELVSAFHELVDVIDVLQSDPTSVAVEQRLLRLYEMYCAEWDMFPIRPSGWPRRDAA
jgi:hypothetical protein